MKLVILAGLGLALMSGTPIGAAEEKAPQVESKDAADPDTAQPQKKAPDNIEMLAQRPLNQPLNPSPAKADPDDSLIEELDKADLAQQ